MSRRWSQEHQWPQWSPGQWPKKNPAKGGHKGEKGDNSKKGGEKAPVARSYDTEDSTVAPSSSAGSTQQDGMQEFLKFLGMAKALGQPLPDQLKSLLPNVEREDLKGQQKRLNRLRSLRNRIESKEKALQQDEKKWEAWLREMKETIVMQKKNHLETQERLTTELKSLRKEEEDLKNGVEVEQEEIKDEEMELEELIDGYLGEGPEMEAKKKNKVKESESLVEIQRNMEEQYKLQLAKERAQMQAEMNHMMQQFLMTQGKTGVEVVDLVAQDANMVAKQSLPDAPMLQPDNMEGTNGGLMETAKKALMPFGVARRVKTQQATSPYGREQNMEELMAEAKDENKLKEKNGEQGDGKSPDTGQGWLWMLWIPWSSLTPGEVQEDGAQVDIT